MPQHSPSSTRRARASAALACALLTATMLTAGCATVISGEAVAGAKNSQIGPPIDSDTVSLRHDYEESAQDVNDYWTEDRRKNAKPRVTDPGDNGSGTFDAPPDAATGVVIDPTTGPVSPDGPQVPDSSAGELFAATGLAASTQGRLYMSFSDGDGVCSASVVNSASGSVVATAAHCVWDFAADDWGTNMWFVPADADNTAVMPYGAWNAESVIAPQTFLDTAKIDETFGLVGDGWAYDFAFLVMGANDQGQQIQEVTGGQGIAFGVPAEELLVTGYPSAPPFDGLSQRYCATSQWDPGMRGTYTFSCDMTQGASGGGWFTNYDPVSGSGYLVATTSYRGYDFIGAAPLGESALQIFTEIGGL
ncbi:hypothetical protein SAMN05216410_0842 [Sanguibacter gelidistatuariae]|uniref:V8-like Glu-specific endopeptidase n=1 Tax=Sanguibacter gelidistatuariae TaxID=1814289 RepID=A0A1G6H994_9MICO|nr:hypothetical protein [Sanguibacter gelidistatuariae]SDB90724.1 hypothetical protein SAMN05216410_0842 [Sanguibacter gelidistatuariae]